MYIFTEIYRRIAVYKSTVYFSRCLFVEMEEGYLKKTYCRDLLSLIHITYGTHIKTKYMYMRFLTCVADTVCPPLFCLKLIYSTVLVTEGKGSSEDLPLLWLLYADLGQTGTETHTGFVGLVCLGVHTCHKLILVFLNVTFLLFGHFTPLTVHPSCKHYFQFKGVMKELGFHCDGQIHSEQNNFARG